ncbi:hypothetical protein [Georgenia sp. AZ-5]|uniref:hypothetical protein n=1 Tax=Georgenia sp. AZ-5 TaxID=3367526 RepID=UPI0037541001
MNQDIRPQGDPAGPEHEGRDAEATTPPPSGATAADVTTPLPRHEAGETAALPADKTAQLPTDETTPLPRHEAGETAALPAGRGGEADVTEQLRAGGEEADVTSPLPRAGESEASRDATGPDARAYSRAEPPVWSGRAEGGPAVWSASTAPLVERPRGPRSGTLVLGLVLVVLGAVAVLVALGYSLDMQLVLIALLLLAALTLLGVALVRGRASRRREEAPGKV